MADDKLYLFWSLIAALFIFAMVYSWFIAVIVRKMLPGELAWVFMGLAFIAGSNAFIRSGQQVIDPHSVMLVSRAMFFMVAVSSCVSVVVLGIQYNGAVSSRLPLRQQVETLMRAFLPQGKGVNDGS